MPAYVPTPKRRRPLWQRLLDGVRALSTRLWPLRQHTQPPQIRWQRRLGRDREQETLRIDRYLLVVVRTHTSLDRVLELLRVVGQGVHLAIKFTIEYGSKFARDLADKLRALGAEEIPWEVARSLYWDAIFAAHVDNQLAELQETFDSKIFVVAHGAGYNRARLASTGGRPGAAGLSTHELTRDGQLIVSLVGLSDFEQSERLCEEARGCEIVIGDLVMDKLINYRQQQRRRFRRELGVGRRKLILISSTWGPWSTYAKAEWAIRRLVADLPSNEYAVALVLHNNIWYGHSKFEICLHLRDEIAAGLLIIDPTTWQSALVAADLVVGDHGSVTTGYAVGMKLPVLIAADGTPELDPASPYTALHAALPRLCDAKPLREQVDRAIAEHAPDQWKQHSDRLFALPGEGLKAAANALRRLLDLPPFTENPRIGPMEPPMIVDPQPVTAHRAVVTSNPDSTARIERYPAVLNDAKKFYDSVLAITDRENDPTLRSNAEVLVHVEQLPDDEAEEWIDEQLPTIGLVAAATESGRVLLRFSDGKRITTTRGDPYDTAILLHWRRTHGVPFDSDETPD